MEHSKVYILESPSANDVLDNRFEGQALSQALNLAGIKNSYYNVYNSKSLTEAFARIIQDVNRKDNILGVVDLHFSMHGNKNGIALTSGEFYTWDVLQELIRWFNEKVGYVWDEMLSPGMKYGAARLNFSVCEGYHCKLMTTSKPIMPYTAILGPEMPVKWSTSLVAFMSFYHNVLQNKMGWVEAVMRMNIAVGEKELFKIHVADGLNRKDIPKELLDKYIKS